MPVPVNGCPQVAAPRPDGADRAPDLASERGVETVAAQHCGVLGRRPGAPDEDRLVCELPALDRDKPAATARGAARSRGSTTPGGRRGAPAPTATRRASPAGCGGRSGCGRRGSTPKTVTRRAPSAGAERARAWVLLRGHRCCCVRCRVQAEPGGMAVRPARTRRGLLRVGKRWRTLTPSPYASAPCGGGRGPRVAREPRAPGRYRTGRGRRHAARATASVSIRGVVLVERPARRLRAPLPSCWSGFRIVMALRGRYRRPEVRRQTFGRRSLPIDRPVAGCRGEWAPLAPGRG